MAYMDDLRNAILAEAPKLGLDPVDIASIFSYETGGTFDPWKAGPVTQWGQHRGLFQAGEPQQRQYGLAEGMPVGDQVSAFMRYLADNGVRYGDRLPELYSTVNTGSPSKLFAKDLRGTSVYEKLQNEFPAHREKALSLLGMAGAGSPNYRGGAARGVIPSAPEADPFAGLDYQDSGELIMGPYEEVVSDDAADPKSREFFEGSMATTYLGGKLTGGAAGRKDSVTGFQPSFRQGLAAMIQNAPPGIDISIGSGYRSQEVQDELFRKAVIKYGSEAKARHWVAKHSRHTLGIAADLKFGDEKAQQWAHANAEKFGLTFRLGHEPWHIEPIDATGGRTVVDDPNFDSEAFDATGGTTGPVILNAVDPNGLIKPNEQQQEPYQLPAAMTFLQTLASPVSAGMNIAADVVREEAGIPEAPEEELTWDIFEEKLRRALIAGPLEIGSSLPWKIGAGIVAPGEWAGRHLGELTNPDVDQSQIPSITDWLWQQGVKGDEWARGIAGVEAPTSSSDVAAEMGPGNIIMSGGPGGAVAKLAVTEAATLIAAYGPEVIQSLRDFVFGPVVAETPVPGAPVVEPPGVDKAMYNTLGPLAILSALGAGFPYVTSGAAKFLGYQKPSIRQLPNAPKGALSLTRGVDVLNSILFDKDRGVMAIIERSGFPKAVSEYIDDVVKTHLRSGAKALATSAIVNGRAETVNRSFRVTTPIIQVENAIRDQPVYGQYINVLNLIDKFKSGKYGRIIQDETISTARTLKRQIEAAHPKAKDVAKAYREHLEETQRFIQGGTYGLNNPVPPKRPYWIPVAKEETVDPLFIPNPASQLRSWSEVVFTEALHNEARGTVIEGFQTHSPYKEIRKGAMVPVSQKALDRHPSWAPNVVNYSKGGKHKQVYTDDFMADWLQTDPFSYNSHIINTAHWFKQLIEKLTTGVFAPHFAMTQFVRNWQGILMTKPPGWKGPGITGPFTAIPAQVFAKGARALAETIDSALMRDNSSFWGSFPNLSKSLSAMASAKWNKSKLALMEQYGPHAGTYMDNPDVIMSQYQKNLTGLMQMAQQPGKLGHMGKVLVRTMGSLARGWTNVMSSTHGAAAYSTVRRNMNRRPQSEWPHIVKTGPELTGSPRTQGQSYIRDPKTHQMRMIRGPGWGLVKPVAALVSEIGRETVPWFDPILSGMGAMAKAYWRDPVRFTGRIWMYQIAPTVGTYMYNRSLGPEYTNYQMNERSLVKQATSIYVAIKGLAPELGLEFAIPQELAFMHSLAETLAHYSLPSLEKGGHSIEMSDALWDLAENFLRRVVLPPAPVIETLPFAIHGYNPPTSIAGDDIFERKRAAFDQLGGPLPAGIEEFLRETGGTFMQIFIEALNAAAASDNSLGESIENGLTEMYKGTLSRTPILGPLTGAVPNMSSDTRIAKELTDKKDALDELAQFWEKTGQYYAKGKRPEINIEPRSKIGGWRSDRLTDSAGSLGQPSWKKTAPYPGEVQPPPTNELYKFVMKAIHDNLMTDKSGYIFKGYLSLNEQLGNIILAQDSMRKVDSSKFVGWAALVKSNPNIRKVLGGMPDPKDIWDPERAGNYLQRQRNKVERELLMAIKKVEENLSQRAGREVKLEDLHPYDEDEPAAPPETYDPLSLGGFGP